MSRDGTGSRRGMVAAVLAFAVVSGGLLFVAGWNPGGMPGTADATPTTDAAVPGTDAGSGTGTEAGAGTGTGSSPDGSTDTNVYDFTIERIEQCGNTCRNVTARLSNTGETVRENVRVTTKVLADGDLLWSGNESVGALGPGESHTSTRRVNVGFAGGLKISANDGWITIVTVVRSDAGTARFEDRRKVG